MNIQYQSRDLLYSREMSGAKKSHKMQYIFLILEVEFMWYLI